MTEIKTKAEAEKAFAEVEKTWKRIINFFETKEDSHLPITDRVKTFADIERISGKTLTQRDDETTDEFAYRQVKLIAEVYNQGETLDPMNTSQNKYYPWHKIDNSSGFGLSFRAYDDWNSTSDVGVRLCFKTSDLAIDAGKKFIEIYSQLKIK